MIDFMAEKEKRLAEKKNEYYFGGPVPREVQDRLEACRDRGMANQTIARKLAYLWLALPAQKQNQLYFSSIDADFDPQDRGIADLLALVDDVMVGNLLAHLPQSARLAALLAEPRPPASRQRGKRSLPAPQQRPAAG